MRFFIGLALALALGVMGCSDASGTGGTHGDGGSGGGGSAGVGGGPTASVTVFVGESDPELPGIGLVGPLPGVTVCEVGADNCDTTDAGGSVLLDVSANREVTFTADKSGYTPMLGGGGVFQSDVTGFVSIPLTIEAYFDDMHERVMAPYPMEGTGSVRIHLVEGDVAGSTFSITPSEGTLFYRDEDHNWDPDLAATTPDGGGGYAELPPGEYQVVVSGTAENCSPVRGWVGTTGNAVRFLVAEGYVTDVRMACD